MPFGSCSSVTSKHSPVTPVAASSFQHSPACLMASHPYSARSACCYLGLYVGIGAVQALRQKLLEQASHARHTRRPFLQARCDICRSCLFGCIADEIVTAGHGRWRSCCQNSGIQTPALLLPWRVTSCDFGSSRGASLMALLSIAA